jgi:hypothetical protein
LEKGSCATLRWSVLNAQIAHLFGGQFGAAPGVSVALSAQRTVCPSTSAVYTLHATSAGRNFDQPLTLVVHDTTPPPAPLATGPSTSYTVPSCAANSVALKWNAVTDVSGIARYEWQIYHIESLGAPPRVTQFAIVDDQGQTTVTNDKAVLHDCDTYVLVVRAVDKANNAGPNSTPLPFEIKPIIVE